MNARRFGRHVGRDVSRRMLDKLNNPEEKLKFVHIAGTNGKGSTTAFLAKIMEQTGMKIGMFTSPHLVDFEERIRINGVYISKEDVTRLGNLLLNTEFVYPPTMFDYCFVMALLYFVEQHCDLVILETGIGGKYDSTNILDEPELIIITPIGMDHMAILGDTIEEIAWQKFGVVKPYVPLVMAPQQEGLVDMMRNRYVDLHISFQSDSNMFRGIRNREEIAKDVHVVTQRDIAYARKLPKKMLGAYQNINAASAILAARCLLGRMCPEYSSKRIEKLIRDGIAEATWQGRMELINEHPFFLVDGAHNSHGVHALAESLKTMYPKEKFHFIMAVMADKDYEAMIDELLPLAIDFVTVTPESQRALQARDLAECIRRRGVKATYSDDMRSVIGPLLIPAEEPVKKELFARKQTSGEKTIAFGSLYFIGAIEAMR